MTLAEMKSVDIRTIDPKELVDIRNVQIDPEKDKSERIKDYVEQIKNPYCYKVGKVVVKVSFSDDDVSLEDRLESLLMKL